MSPVHLRTSPRIALAKAKAGLPARSTTSVSHRRALRSLRRLLSLKLWLLLLRSSLSRRRHGPLRFLGRQTRHNRQSCPPLVNSVKPKIFPFQRQSNQRQQNPELSSAQRPPLRSRAYNPPNPIPDLRSKPTALEHSPPYIRLFNNTRLPCV